MSSPVENQKGYKLVSKVERTVAGDHQHQQHERKVPTDPRNSNAVGNKSVHRSLVDSVFEAPQLLESPQDPVCLSRLFDSVIAPRSPTQVQYCSFADLGANLRANRKPAESVSDRAVNSFTKITSGTDSNDHSAKIKNNYTSSSTDNSNIYNAARSASNIGGEHSLTSIHTDNNSNIHNAARCTSNIGGEHSLTSINTDNNSDISQIRHSTDVNTKYIKITGNNVNSDFTNSTGDHQHLNFTGNTFNNTPSGLTGSNNNKYTSPTSNSTDSRTANTTDTDNSSIGQEEQISLNINSVYTAANLSIVSDVSPTSIKCKDMPSQIPELPYAEINTEASSDFFDQTLDLYSRFELQSVQETSTTPNTKIDCIPADSSTITSNIHVEKQQLTQTASEPTLKIKLKSPIQSGFKSITQAESVSFDKKAPISPGTTSPGTTSPGPTSPRRTIPSKPGLMSQTTPESLTQKLPKTGSLDKLEHINPGGIELDANTLIKLDSHAPVELKEAAKSEPGPIFYGIHKPSTEIDLTLVAHDIIVSIADPDEPMEKPMKQKDPRERKPTTLTNQEIGSSSKPIEIDLTLPDHSNTESVADPNEPLEKPAKKKDPRGRKPKALTNQEIGLGSEPIKSNSTLTAQDNTISVGDSSEPLKKKDPRGRKPKVLTNQEIGSSSKPIEIDLTLPDHSNTESVADPNEPLEKPAKKKDPRGRKPKALSNQKIGSSSTSAKAPAKNKAEKTSHLSEASSSGPVPLKMSKRQAEKRADLKVKEEAEKRIAAAGTTIRSGKAHITAKAKTSRQEDNPSVQLAKAINESFRCRKRRGISTAVSYRDVYDDYYEDEDVRVVKREKKTPTKEKGELSSSSKIIKEIPKPVVRPRRVSAKAKGAKEDTLVDKLIVIDTEDEVEETKIVQSKTILKKKPSDEDKIDMLLQSRESKLTKVDFKELIPGWLEAMTEKDKQELALLLPEPDRVVGNNHVSIRPNFGKVSTTHFYEAAEKWQDILFLGGFEPNNEVVVDTVEDSFKDENYEKHWGERIAEFHAEKRKREEDEQSLPRKKRSKGKGKAK